MRTPFSGQPMALIYVFLVFLTAAGLKFHYSRAHSEQLMWILAPTAAVVEAIGGMGFEHETQTGFVNRAHGIIIAPSCAGINFLITAFVMAAFTGFSRLRGMAVLLIRGVTGFVVAFTATVGVNALRIVAAYHLYRADIYGDVWTPQGVHRAVGALIYCLALSLLYGLLAKKTGTRRTRQKREGSPKGAVAEAVREAVVPAGWYLAMTIGVPLLNGALLNERQRFTHHALTVAAVALAVALTAVLLRLSFVHIGAKMPSR